MMQKDKTPDLATCLAYGRGLCMALGVVALSGCALFATNSGASKERFLPDIRFGEAKEARDSAAGASPTGGEVTGKRETAFFETPKPPPAARTATQGTPQPAASAEKDEVTSAVALENMPLPQFVNAIYGVVLKKNVSMDPAVQQRTDLVSLRTGKPQSATQLAAAAQAVLRSYGVAVNEFQGLVRVVPETGQGGYLPEIRRGRAQPDVPAGLRPVFYLAELEHTPVANVVNWLRTLFPNRLTLTEDAQRNAIMLSGQSDTVSAAMEAIQLLDQPLLRGRLSARITPVFMSADEMARRLVEVLVAEGYSAGMVASMQTPILVLPIGPVNSVVVFAANEQILNHTLRWARELDQTPSRSGNFVTYYVRNTDAADLAKTLQEVMAGSGATAPAAPGTSATAAAGGKKVVVNAAANSLIIQTNPAEYQQWYGLLQELDRPARSALIMATVAEVYLTDEEQFGFNWLLRQFVSHGMNVTGGVGLGAQPAVGTFRLNFASLAGDPRAILTALASSNRVRILSNPSVVALNGQTATIQVGQEVPILTSQISNANTGTSTGGILQTIQYRNTGVILKVKPVIHSGGRVDIEVGQEVSAVEVAQTGIGNSPIISTRRVDTRMSLTDGNTTLLGGLIEDTRSSGDAGLPYLKDIPIAGALFRTSASSNTRRKELVVLLTPYIMNDEFESRAVTEAFRNQFAWSASLPAMHSGLKGGAANEAEFKGPDRGRETSSGERVKTPEPPSASNPPNKAPLPMDRPAKTSSQPNSKPYVLPESDAPVLMMSTTVAPQQHSPASIGARPVVNPPTPAPPVANSQRGSEVSLPQNAKPVTDDNLKRELLEAIRGGR